MSKFMKRLQKTQSDVTVSDRTSQFVNSHRNKYLHLSHAMKIFDKEDEIQTHHLPKTAKHKDSCSSFD